jgi:HEAT repeat protein
MQEATRQWISWLTSGNASERKRATFELGNLKTTDNASVTALVEALMSENDNVTFWVVVALGRLRSRSRKSVPLLIELLAHKKRAIRQATVSALSAVAPNDDRVKQALFACFKDKSPFVRRQALQAVIEVKNLTRNDLTLIGAMKNDVDESVARWSEIALRNIRLRAKRRRP